MQNTLTDTHTNTSIKNSEFIRFPLLVLKNPSAKLQQKSIKIMQNIQSIQNIQNIQEYKLHV